MTAPAPAPRRGGFFLACALACILGCASRQEQTPPVLAPAARVAPGTPSSASSQGAGSAPAAAGAGAAVSEGTPPTAPPSAADPDASEPGRSADDPAKAGRARLASPDGERVVFVQPEGPKGKPSLWVSRKDGGEPRKLVDVETAKVENPPRGITLAEATMIFDLSFSADGKKVYFQTDGWTTSAALYVVDLDGAKLRFVHDANGYTVIRACTDQQQVGLLIINQHSYFDPIPSSPVDWYFLIDEKGKRLGIVGPETENVDRFMAKRCGIGVAPPDPPKAEVPPRLRTPRLDCGRYVVKHNPLRFLDGTGLELFFVTDKERSKDAWPFPDVLSLTEAEPFVAANCPARKKP